MDAFYFGKPDKQLFGIYHEARYEADREEGVVLCYPIGQEYIRSHRSYQQLALKLSDIGYHVLRFDYFGCGDSAGEAGEGDIERWTQDIGLAVAELRENSDADDISLIGLRLGASLACRAALQIGGIKRVALWEPVLSGCNYIDESLRVHKSWLDDQLDRPHRRLISTEVKESLGFPLPATMESSIRGFDLLSIEKAPAQDVLMLACERIEAYDRIADRLRQLGAQADVSQIPAPRVWLREERLDNSLVPFQSLKALIDWFAREK